MKRVLVLSSLLILLVLASASATTRSNSDCSSCHYSKSGSAGYRYVPPSVLLSVPMFVEPGKTFDVTVKVIFSQYDLKSVEIELFQEPELFDFARTSQREGHPSPDAEFIFTGKAGSEGTVEISIVVTADVHYDHQVGTNEDRREEIIEKKTVVNVGDTSVKPSAWSVMLAESGSELELRASREVDSVMVYTPPGISAEPDLAKRLGPGSPLRISLIPDGGEAVDSNLIISWRENGTPYSIEVGVIYTPDVSSDYSIDHLAARIAGLVTVMFLAASLILGGLWNTRGYLNRKIKARTRVRFHCAVSWFLVALSVYHALLLMLGTYSRQLLDGPLIIAYLSMLAMLTAGLSGGFQRGITRMIKPVGWRYLHLYSTLGALGLGMFHGIRIGTDLAFIRNSSFGFVLAIIFLVAVILTAALIRPRKKNVKKESGDKVSESPAVDTAGHWADRAPESYRRDMIYKRLMDEATGAEESKPRPEERFAWRAENDANLFSAGRNGSRDNEIWFTNREYPRNRSVKRIRRFRNVKYRTGYDAETGPLYECNNLDDYEKQMNWK